MIYPLDRGICSLDNLARMSIKNIVPTLDRTGDCNWFMTSSQSADLAGDIEGWRSTVWSPAL